MHHAVEIDPQDVAPVVERRLLDRPRPADARVVDHHVEPAALVDGSLDERFDLLVVGDVALLEITPEFVRGRLSSFFGTICDHDAGVVRLILLGDCAADSRRSARYDGDFLVRHRPARIILAMGQRDGHSWRPDVPS